MSDWLSTAWNTYVMHPEHGNGYQFWSGVGGMTAMLGALGTVYRKHNCHVRWCWRLGRHPVDGTDWVVCRNHHPDDKPKHYLPEPKDVEEAHDRNTV